MDVARSENIRRTRFLLTLLAFAVASFLSCETKDSLRLRVQSFMEQGLIDRLGLAGPQDLRHANSGLQGSLK